MEFDGIPLHPLVVHGAVVLGPLTVLLGLAYVAVPKIQYILRWPLLVGALVTVGFVWITKESGEDLLRANSGLSAMPVMQEHMKYAGWLWYATLVFAVGTIATSILHDRPGVVKWLPRVAMVGGGIALLVTVFLTGHAGADAVW